MLCGLCTRQQKLITFKFFQRKVDFNGDLSGRYYYYQLGRYEEATFLKKSFGQVDLTCASRALKKCRQQELVEIKRKVVSCCVYDNLQK